MGSRDYRHKEVKKTKKDSGKLSSVTIFPTPVQVEVAKKGKKKRGAEEQE